MSIRLVIADDHAVLRAGLRMLLSAQADMMVVAEASDGEEAVMRVEEERPDVLLLDLSMPGSSGLDVIQRIKALRPDVRILILTMHDDEGYLRRALEAGSSGYVLKRAADAELLTAIRAVARGGAYLHQEHVGVLLRGTSPKANPSPVDAYDSLSPRERQVLKLVALGHTNQQVADMLYLSVKTAETYRARLMVKLGLASRAALVRYALAHGLLDESAPSTTTS